MRASSVDGCAVGSFTGAYRGQQGSIFISSPACPEATAMQLGAVAQPPRHAQLFCCPMDCSPPGSSVQEISQARTLDWGAISSSRGSSQPRNQTRVSCTDNRILYHRATSGADVAGTTVLCKVLYRKIRNPFLCLFLNVICVKSIIDPLQFPWWL